MQKANDQEMLKNEQGQEAFSDLQDNDEKAMTTGVVKMLETINANALSLAIELTNVRFKITEMMDTANKKNKTGLYLAWRRCNKSTCLSCPHGPYWYAKSPLDKHSKYIGTTISGATIGRTEIVMDRKTINWLKAIDRQFGPMRDRMKAIQNLMMKGHKTFAAGSFRYKTGSKVG